MKLQLFLALLVCGVHAMIIVHPECQRYLDQLRQMRQVIGELRQHIAQLDADHWPLCTDTMEMANIPCRQIGPCAATLEADIKEPSCDAPLAYGTPCSGNDATPAARWHFDQYRFMCIAFTHTGCGPSNGNSYATKEQCQRCLPADYGCRGGAQLADSAGVIVDESDFTDDMPYPVCSVSAACPRGYNCMQAMVAMCCNATVDAWYAAAYADKCPSGRDAYTFFNGQYDEHVIGTSCNAHRGGLTCPAGHECAEVNHLFAKCCELPRAQGGASGQGDNDGDVQGEASNVASIVLKALMKWLRSM